jgi:hypothetical protein
MIKRDLAKHSFPNLALVCMAVMVPCVWLWLMEARVSRQSIGYVPTVADRVIWILFNLAPFAVYCVWLLVLSLSTKRVLSITWIAISTLVGLASIELGYCTVTGHRLADVPITGVLLVPLLAFVLMMAVQLVGAAMLLNRRSA